MSAVDCSICCFPFNKTGHRRHECSNCHHEACLSCHKTFLLGSSNDARCMNCNVAWSTVYLFRNFPSSFVKEYRNTRRNAIWNRELFHLPTLVEYVDLENRYKAAKKEEEDLDLELLTLRNSYRDLKGRRDKEATKLRAGIRLLKSTKYNQHRAKSGEASNCNSNMYRIKHRFMYPDRALPQRRSAEVNSSYRNRPCIKEDCRGFINGEGKCPICSTLTCLDCNVEITEGVEHTCKQCDIDNWCEIRDNSRPCPSCHVYIFKISGCNQMYCTNCSTAFNWVTGMIETGPVHNPHYYEQLFANPEQIERRRQLNFGNRVNPDEYCDNGALIDLYSLKASLDRRRDLPEEKKISVLTRHRQLNHVLMVTLPRIGSIDNTRYRRYIFDALYEHLQGGDVAVKVERFLNRKILNGEYATLVQTYINQQKQLFRAIANQTITVEEFETHHDEFKKIMQDTIKDYNKIFKKSLKIDL